MATHRSVLSTSAVACMAVAAWLAGCASTRLDAQWADPQLSPNPLRGARVMVVCEAYDLAVKRICQDQMAAEVVARGGTAVQGPDDNSSGAPVRPLNNDQYLGAARSAGAKAVLTHSITAADVAYSGSGVSIGIGGFGYGGGRGSSTGVGVGVSMPVGGQQSNTGYAMNSRVTDVSSGKLLWTAKASASPSADVSAQLSELHKVVFGAADKAQLF